MVVEDMLEVEDDSAVSSLVEDSLIEVEEVKEIEEAEDAEEGMLLKTVIWSSWLPQNRFLSR